MKIEFSTLKRIVRVGIFAALCMMVLEGAPAWAAAPSTEPTNPAPVPPQTGPASSPAPQPPVTSGLVPATTPAPVTMPSASAAPSIIPPAVPSPSVNSMNPPSALTAATSGPSIIPPPADIKLPEGDKDTKGIKSAETKLTDSVQEVVKHIESSNDNMTINDLNSAAQAVAKIKALIEVEKSLAEFQKIRQEREGKSMIAQIPASALGGGGHFSPPPIQSSSSDMLPPPPVVTPKEIEVSRIVGSAGHYTAMIKTSPDAQAKPMRVGDRLEDGSKVISISSAGVKFDGRANKGLIHVKDAGTVFTSSIP